MRSAIGAKAPLQNSAVVPVHITPGLNVVQPLGAQFALIIALLLEQLVNLQRLHIHDRDIGRVLRRTVVDF